MGTIYVDVSKLSEHSEKAKVRKAFLDFGWDEFDAKFADTVIAAPLMQRTVTHWVFTSHHHAEPPIPEIPSCCTISPALLTLNYFPCYNEPFAFRVIVNCGPEFFVWV